MDMAIGDMWPPVAPFYTVSQNVSPLACYNFGTHEWILIFLAEMLQIK